MAVSKALRFAVLARDNHTCRYCGAKAPSVVLHVDHVVPVALGGMDVPENLVAACVDCNTGKAATSLDAQAVADIQADTMRWARAIAAAAAKVAEDAAVRETYLFYVEGEWTGGRMPPHADLPDDWEITAWNFYARGLPLVEIDEALLITSNAGSVPAGARWRYFCGICWNKLRALEDHARSIVDSGEVD